ncbi:hypothetical protein [Spirosoma sp.]|uniref:hypothetical protein n=1 Tax=Spirosoma sp. TaxID=1899569 RepID=UPI002608AAD4|nr:hypothetical protein [Spirosoma sp.]MCX6217606.1 hypothetical protein [Spirosoma sp.]
MLDYQRDILPYLQLDAEKRPPAPLRHSFYQASIDHRNRLAAVFGKAYPYYLDLNRPKETETYRDYRRKIYKNPLRSLRRRVSEVLDYIRQADDFQVSYPQQEDEIEDSLQSLLTDSNYMPDGDSESWFFKHIRKRYINDPNAVLVVLPFEQPESEQVRARPEPMLIDCEKVYQFRAGKFAVLESNEKTYIITGKGIQKVGKVFIFLDHDSYCIARQMQEMRPEDPNSATLNTWQITGLNQLVTEQGEVIGNTFTPLPHYCPMMPARKIGKLQEDFAEAEQRNGNASPTSGNSVGMMNPEATGNYNGRFTAIRSEDTGEEYYESILADAMPHVESAQAIQSDIEVERNFHVSSQEWRYAQKRCVDSSMDGGPCNNGKIAVRNLEQEVIASAQCPKCKGTGMDTSGSGLGLIIVSPPTANTLGSESSSTSLPTPPGGFIPRSIDPIKEFVLEFEREKKAAHEVVNMQFLMESPISQSGIAKRADREELYRTLIVQGVHLCGLLEFLLLCAAYQRGQPEQAPKVLAPVRLTIENSELTRDELIDAVKNGLDANYRKPLEKKLIAYQVGEDSDYYKRYELKEKLDPYEELDFEKKEFLLATARVTMQPGSVELENLNLRIALSIHFNGLVADLIRTKPGFLDMDTDVQYKLLLDAVRPLTGLAKPVPIDPETGMPDARAGILEPIVDLKNVNQLH